MPLLLVVLSLALLGGCLKTSDERNRPCPCAEGWTCCPGRQICLAAAADCPAQLDAGVDGGIADGGPLHLVVKKTGAPPSVDGKLDEAVWTTLPHAISRLTKGRNDNTSTFDVLWDDAYLYVGVKVLDSNLRNDSPDPWGDDSVEIYVDGAGERGIVYDGNDRQLIKGWNDVALFAAQNGTGVLHATADILGGYTAELAIPWSNLGVTPSPHITLGFDVQQNDDDTGGNSQGAMSWNAVHDTNYMSTVHFGLLTLSPSVVGGGGGSTGGGGGGSTGGGGGGSTGGGGGSTGGGGGSTGGGGGGATGGGGGSTGPTWQQVPMTTKAQRTAGIAGGEGWQVVVDFAFSLSNPNVVYLVSDTNQVWKSTDSGSTWHRRSNGFTANGGRSLSVDPTNANIVYVAASANIYPELTGNAEGIFRTTNGGDSWTNVKNTHFDFLAASGKNFAFAGSSIYAGPSSGGLLKSTDGGTTWNLVPKVGGGSVLDTTGVYDLKAHPTNSTTFFAATSDGAFYRIVDGSGSGGATVTRIGSGLPGRARECVIDPLTPANIYCTVNASGVFKSTDQGVTFSSINTGLSQPLAMGGRAARMAIDSTNPSKLLVAFTDLWGTYLYWTTNGGATWTQASSFDVRNADGWICGSVFNYDGELGIDDTIQPVAYKPGDGGSVLTVGFGNQIRKSTDGGMNWRFSNSGYTAALAPTIAWDATNPLRAVVAHGDFGPSMTEDGEDTFRSINSAVYNDRHATTGTDVRGSIVVEGVGATNSWADANNTVLTVSRDSGRTWTNVPDTAGSYPFVRWHPQRPDIVYAGDKKFTSITQNSNWSPLPRKVYAVFKGNGDIVYSMNAQSIFKSTDGGLTFVGVYPHLGAPAGSAIVQIAVDPINQDRLYAAVPGHGVYVVTGTTANGGTVLARDARHGLALDAFGMANIRFLATDPVDSNVVYAASYSGAFGHANGIFRSTDAGLSWTNINGNLGSAINVWSVSVNPHNRFVYIGTFAGTWKLPPP